MSEITAKETPAAEAVRGLSAHQAAALAAAVARIACQVTGSPHGDPGMAFTRLGLSLADVKALTGIGAS